MPMFHLIADNKNPKTSSGRGIHSWLDNESTTETFSQYEKMNRDCNDPELDGNINQNLLDTQLKVYNDKMMFNIQLNELVKIDFNL